MFHSHTKFSIGDGLGSVEHMVSRYESLGYKHSHISDHGNIMGWKSFDEQCRQKGLKPIFGCEAYLKGNVHVNLIPMNYKGYLELIQILNQNKNARFEDLTKTKNLLIGTACVKGLIGQNMPIKLLNKKRLFGEVFPYDTSFNKKVTNECKSLGVPVIVSSDSHYYNEDNNNSLYNRFKSYFSMKQELDLFLRGKDQCKRIYKKCFRTLDWILDNVSDFKFSDIIQPIRKDTKEEQNLLRKKCLCEIKRRKLNKKYLKRFEYEFDVLCKTKFCWYILEIEKIVRHFKHLAINVGPGRGSAAGCLINYLLNITLIDPLQYDLSFDRFITEERKDYPDIDIDISSFDRNKAFKDKELEMFDVVGLVKLGRKSVSIKEGSFSESDYDILGESYKNKTIHPSAKVKIQKDMIKRFHFIDNVLMIEGSELESYGIIKFDVLGLSALDKCKSFNRLDFIKMDDKKVFKNLKKGNVSEIHGFDTFLAKKASQSVECFEDLVQVQAVIRPGAKEIFEEWIKSNSVKRSKMILFQEQILKWLLKSGFTPSEADTFRKGMAKKKIEIIEQFRKDFFKSNNFTDKEKRIIWKKIKECSGYSFNRSHAVCYAAIAYNQIFEKIHNPARFYCRCLNSNSSIQSQLKLLSEYQGSFCNTTRVDRWTPVGFNKICIPESCYSQYNFFKKELKKEWRFLKDGLV